MFEVALLLFFPDGRLCSLKHEVPFEAVAWRTAVFMTVFSLAVIILRSFDWSFYCSKVNFFSGFQFLGQFTVSFENCYARCLPNGKAYLRTLGKFDFGFFPQLILLSVFSCARRLPVDNYSR